VRDEFAVLQSLGIDPYALAADLARVSPVTGKAMRVNADSGPFAGRYPNPTLEGVSGARPPRFAAECDMISAMFDEVWNARRFDRASAYCSPKVVCHSVRMRRAQGIDPYQNEIIDLLAAFPDGRIEVRDLVVCDSSELGMRIAAIWVLHATYSGVPLYGKPTHTPVKILGASHYEIHEGKILREWRIYDELAVLAQIAGAREDAQRA